MKKIMKSMLLGLTAIAVLASCDTKKQEVVLTASGLNPADFESTIDTLQTALYTLKYANGMEVCITNFGGRVVSIMVPDKNGEMKDVVLGFDNVATFADKENHPSDFGAAIGRYANRIAQGKITVEGKEIQLPQNNFGHCLH